LGRGRDGQGRGKLYVGGLFREDFALGGAKSLGGAVYGGASLMERGRERWGGSIYCALVGGKLSGGDRRIPVSVMFRGAIEVKTGR